MDIIYLQSDKNKWLIIKRKYYRNDIDIYHFGDIIFIKMKGTSIMSKYDPLWNYIKENGTDSFKLTYAEIEKIAGLPIDHSFLTYKKELLEYGYKVGKISMKEQTVAFEKTE